jgi:hypothetical protein
MMETGFLNEGDTVIGACADGLAPYKSSTTSLWSLFGVNYCLPPDIRYLERNLNLLMIYPRKPKKMDMMWHLLEFVCLEGLNQGISLACFLKPFKVFCCFRFYYSFYILFRSDFPDSRIPQGHCHPPLSGPWLHLFGERLSWLSWILWVLVLHPEGDLGCSPKARLLCRFMLKR